MLTCKKVSKTLAETDYADLPLSKKIGLRIHVALCIVCGRFNRQVMTMQDTCRHYKAHEDEVLDKHPGMEDDSKDRLRAALADESARQH